ncbi:type 1 glutamine amidotransferase domain-containing protein [Nocardia higoensis]|uniref:type 1 glutamine amidotransferase domain-containing protein n=1 Tax=Nocardia higoensis TaxID=228599 RepID=UPI00031E1C5A|nr:type 1 glutamine amidotransferase domain-containing protein [Nocardia higoensis]
MAELDGVRVLVVTANTGVEHDELVVPRDRLRERGAAVTHAAPKAEQVSTFRHDLEPAEVVDPDLGLDEVRADDFDVLVLPGGTVNADKLRLDGRAVTLAKSFAGAGKPIAAICHGPWLLAEADLVAGKTLTSYPSLRTDLGNAGGSWVDEPAVRSGEGDWTLITSRNPGDLDDFVYAITREVRAA